MKLKAFIPKLYINEISLRLHSNADNISIGSLLETLQDFDSVTKKLQYSSTTLADARVLLDAMIEKYAEMAVRLEPDAPIVLQPVFQQGLVKIQEIWIMDISTAEKQAVRNSRVAGSEEKDSSISTVISFASQALEKMKIGFISCSIWIHG